MKKETPKTLAKSQQTEQPSVALFDLDYTLISSDCTALWLRFLLTRSVARRLLILALLPWIKWVDKRGVNLAKRNSIYLWAATFGLGRKKYLRLRRDAANHIISGNKVNAYQQAREALDWHHSQGHKVVIITGALHWLARDVCRSLNLRYDLLLGSSERSRWGGRVSQLFCYQEEKVKQLNEYKVFPAGATIYGYSDSAADIPMLSLCHHRYLVNPKPGCYDRMHHHFGDKATRVTWTLV